MKISFLLIVLISALILACGDNPTTPEIKNDLDPDPLRTESWTIKGTFASS